MQVNFPPRPPLFAFSFFYFLEESNKLLKNA